MKIALFGDGKMGKLVEACAIAQGHEIVSKIGRRSSEADWNHVAKAEVCIDFSHSSCVTNHVRFCAKQGKNLIIGTTGWENDEDEVREIVNTSGIGCLYSPNFATGVQLFIRLVEYAAQLLNPFSDYDVNVTEAHHRHKVDAPSGTAKQLISRLAELMPRANELPCTSIRCGYIPGTHTVQFDSPADTITLTHQARNREGFAKGALQAAEWLQGRQGFYTMQDLIDHLMTSTKGSL